MRRTLTCLTFITALLTLSSCTPDDKDIQSRIIGKWRSDFIHSEWGKLKIELEFNKDASIAMTLSDDGSIWDNLWKKNSDTSRGTFFIKDDQLHIDLDGEIQKNKIWFEGRTLKIYDPETEEVYELNRHGQFQYHIFFTILAIALFFVYLRKKGRPERKTANGDKNRNPKRHGVVV